MRTKRFAKVAFPVLGMALYGCGVGADPAAQRESQAAPDDTPSTQSGSLTVVASEEMQNQPWATNLGANRPFQTARGVPVAHRPDPRGVFIAGGDPAAEKWAQLLGLTGVDPSVRGGPNPLNPFGYQRLPSVGPNPAEPLLPEPEAPLSGADFLPLSSLVSIHSFNFDRVTGVAFPRQGLALKAAPLIVPSSYDGLTAVGAVYLPVNATALERGSFLVALDLSAPGATVSGHLYAADGSLAHALLFHREQVAISEERTRFLGQLPQSQHLMPGQLDVDLSASPEAVCFVLNGNSGFERYCSEPGSVLTAKNLLPQSFDYAQALLREGAERLVGNGLFEDLSLDYDHLSSRVEAPQNVEACNQIGSCAADLIRAPILDSLPHDADLPQPSELVLVLREFQLGQTQVQPGMYAVYNRFDGERFAGASLVGLTIYGQRVLELGIPAVPASFVPANAQLTPDPTAPRCTFWDSSCQPQ